MLCLFQVFLVYCRHLLAGGVPRRILLHSRLFIFTCHGFYYIYMETRVKNMRELSDERGLGGFSVAHDDNNRANADRRGA